MTETHDPAGPGQSSKRRAGCPPWCETDHDRHQHHIRNLSTTHDDPVRATLMRSVYDEHDRVLLAPNRPGQGWHGVFVEAFEADDLAGMLDTLGAHEAANDVRRLAVTREAKADGPRADAPVEVIAEADPRQVEL